MMKMIEEFEGLDSLYRHIDLFQLPMKLGTIEEILGQYSYRLFPFWSVLVTR